MPEPLLFLAASDAGADGLAVVVVLLVIVVLIMGFIGARMQGQLKGIRTHADRLAAENHQLRQQFEGAATSRERESTAFAQHTALNELSHKKLEVEVEWLRSQIEARSTVKERDHAWMEYHELMVEKTKLELDSLRLYIAEQRKKLDDFGGFGG